MTVRIIGVVAILLSVVVVCVFFISLEMFGGPAGGYAALHPAALIFFLAPLVGLVLMVTAIRKRASSCVTLLAGSAPLLGQAFIFFAFVRSGILA